MKVGNSQFIYHSENLPLGSFELIINYENVNLLTAQRFVMEYGKRGIAVVACNSKRITLELFFYQGTWEWGSPACFTSSQRRSVSSACKAEHRRTPTVTFLPFKVTFSILYAIKYNFSLCICTFVFRK